MKRSVIIILIASLFLIAACNIQFGTPSVHSGPGSCCVVSDVNTNDIIGCSGLESDNLQCDSHYSSLGNTLFVNNGCDKVSSCDSVINNCFGYDENLQTPYNLQNEEYKCYTNRNYDQSYYCDVGSLSMIEDCQLNSKICDQQTGMCQTNEDSDLKLYMNFNDNTARDLSGNGYNGVLYGNLQWCSDCGIQNSGAFIFDGVDDNIDIVSNSLKNIHNDVDSSTSPNDISYVAYYKIEEINESYLVIFHRGTASNINIDAGGHLGCQYEPNINAKIAFLSGCSLTGLFSNYTESYRIGEWNLLVVTFSNINNRAKVYLNGDLKTTKSITSIKSSSSRSGLIFSTSINSLLIGAQRGCVTNEINSKCQYFNGIIDNILIYKKELTDADVQELYNKINS
ncbi:MAG: LamG domain-containing protein [Nanoarchaeota archaeon]|nr:LamG domain-containing protein [Nanoarchaeota archaeon]MBU0962318.1 LamG domain-containing protein [Nanoarchaeota archaeon]